MYSQGIQIRSIAQFIDASVMKAPVALTYAEYVSKLAESVENDQYMCIDLAIGNRLLNATWQNNK